MSSAALPIQITRPVLSVAALGLGLALSACDGGEPPTVQQAATSQPPTAAAVAPAKRPPSWIGSEACASCHDAEYTRWRGSHHDLAMQPAEEDSVLGRFDEQAFDYAGNRHSFTREADQFLVTTDGSDGQLTQFKVAYTFGVEPLQQYLVQMPDGRLQALPLAWDARPAAAGGQRWFHLYPESAEQPGIDHTSPLHWTGPMQNWNFMCAECHSTRVERRYDPATGIFGTRWQAIDAGCESCHGAGAKHRDWAAMQAGDRSPDPEIVSLASGDAAWVPDPLTGIARRQPLRRDHTEIEGCGRCHARRSQLTEDYRHGDPLLNSHRPALLQDGLYHADGQIDDEVYVYGSFLQSAMYQAGVTCSDCHDPHSLKLKAPGDQVCVQCHLPQTFDTTAHHGHPPDSGGADCVACHMPTKVYMQVDERHDHSFRVPRPDLSVELGVPNTCNGCHADRDAVWADQAITQWHGADREPHYGEVIAAGRAGQAGAARRLLSLADNPLQPAIVRATALSLLRDNPPTEAGAVFQAAARSEHGLLRLAAAESALVLAPQQRVALLEPLLDDPLRAVRQAAGLSLLQAQAVLPAQRNAAWRSAIDDYRQTLELFADRADYQARLGDLETALGQGEQAEAAYRMAQELPGADPSAWTNLADLLRAQRRESEAEAELVSGLEIFPQSAALHHSLGLSRVRQGDAERALHHLRMASELAPSDTRFAYVYGIALNSSGQPEAALEVLDAAHARRPGDRELLLALATVARDHGAAEQALDYAQRLLALDPDDAQAQALVRQLERRP